MFLKEYVIEIEFVESRYNFLGREVINIKMIYKKYMN